MGKLITGKLTGSLSNPFDSIGGKIGGTTIGCELEGICLASVPLVLTPVTLLTLSTGIKLFVSKSEVGRITPTWLTLRLGF